MDKVAAEGSPTKPSLKRPRPKQKANVRRADYVVGNMLIAAEVSIPTTYKHAHASGHLPQQKAAMLAELQSLKGRETWKLVPRKIATNAKAINCHLVFAVKRDKRGCVKRFKARLGIHGFKQQQGVNYNETYAPVIRFDTIRAAIYFAYDVKTAFLYGDLEDLLFMEQPPGFQVDEQNNVYRLLKSLYGLNQAPNI
ncbi:Gag-pol Polyprotein [Phytophthora megakarya]|uniref:Gag-pol Polyprotein n=1 Tax=Phytophthora megakarya TaxID=4795 RepID=A0A225WQ70_9STRA|nr:Gag-pol Polyprotein [Phytophthora megakarya]